MINFNAGPSELPIIVKQQLAEAMIDYNNTGVSLGSLGHRTDDFIAIIDECKSLLYNLCKLNRDTYDIVFMQGGARMQFLLIPLNFLATDKSAAYIDTDFWSELAAYDAKHFGKIKIIASSKWDDYRHIPQGYQIPSDMKYLHITTNNTIYGTQYHFDPDSPIPMIADMSSDILGIERDFNKYHVIYAGAQKNLGISGNTIVIIHRNMKRLSLNERQIPSMWHYDTFIKENSLYNTPNTVAIYTTLLMLRWILACGGLSSLHSHNKRKANVLYNTIDNSGFAIGTAKQEDRSVMNITFRISNKEQALRFEELCADHNIINIKGHRLVGGYRVSLYNAITMEQVTELCAIIKSV